MADNSKESRQQSRRIRLLFTGFTMGLADLVPGVSGGTVAFLFGIYDELLYTIRLMTGQVPRLVLKRQFKSAVSLIPFGFIIPLFAGIVIAIFGLVRVVSYLLDTAPVLVWALFFGLVLGSSLVVSRRIRKWTLKRALLLGAGFMFTFTIVSLPSIGGSQEPLALFGTGAIAITAMILPGISGSLIMVLLGQYEIVINAVADRNITLLAFFAAGIIVGLALFVRVLSWLLKRYHFAVIAFLVGVMLGSLQRIWPWHTPSANGAILNSLPTFDLTLIPVLLLMIGGFGMVLLLERAGLAKEHDDIETRDFKQELKEIEG